MPLNPIIGKCIERHALIALWEMLQESHKGQSVMQEGEINVSDSKRSLIEYGFLKEIVNVRNEQILQLELELRFQQRLRDSEREMLRDIIKTKDMEIDRLKSAAATAINNQQGATA